MSKASGHYVKLGVFVIAGTLLLLIGAYLIGGDQNFLTSTFELHTVFNNVGGLQEGNNVRFSGVNAGTVRAIEMESDTSIRIRMRMNTSLMPHIRKNSIATIGSDGLVGSMLINIVPGQGVGPSVEPGDEIRSFSMLSSRDMLTTLNVTNENAALLTADLLEITRGIRNGSGVLGRLLRDTVLAADLQASIRNLRITTDASKQSLLELRKTIGELRLRESAAALLLDDPEVAGQLRSVTSNLDSSGRELREATARINEMLGSLEQGEGSLGVLLTDSVSANHLRSSLSHLDSGLVKFDQNMEALKHNFLTRRYFRKLEREKEKAEQRE